MICSEAVDNVQVFPECLHVLAGSQHGTNLRSALTDIPYVLLTQEEVMRSHLTCHLDALLLSCPDYQDLITIEGVVIKTNKQMFCTVWSNKIGSLPPPFWPHGRCEPAAGRAEPPSGWQRPSASQREQRWVSVWATSQSALKQKRVVWRHSGNKMYFQVKLSKIKTFSNTEFLYLLVLNTVREKKVNLKGFFCFKNY